MSTSGDSKISWRVASAYGCRVLTTLARGALGVLSVVGFAACSPRPSVPATSATLNGAAAAANHGNSAVLASYLIDDRGRDLSTEATLELLEAMGPELATRIKRAVGHATAATTRIAFRLSSGNEAVVLVRPDYTYVDVPTTTGRCHSDVQQAIRAVHDELKAQLEADLHSPGTLAGSFSSHAVEDWRQDVTGLVEGLDAAGELDPVLSGDVATVTLASGRVLSFVKEFDCWKLEYVK